MVKLFGLFFPNSGSFWVSIHVAGPGERKWRWLFGESGAMDYIGGIGGERAQELIYNILDNPVEDFEGNDEADTAAAEGVESLQTGIRSFIAWIRQ